MLSIVVFLGMMFGSSLWGALASVYGRKVGTALSLAVEGIAGVMAAVAPNFSLLLVFRGLTGIGTGGLATSFSMYAEFLPTGVRGYNLCWYQLFWAVGAVLETILAWLTLPSHGWRVLCLLTALPAIGLFPAVSLLPESPRYLLVAGHRDKAVKVLKKAATINRTSLPCGTLVLPRTTDSRRESEHGRFVEQLTRQVDSLVGAGEVVVYSLFRHPLNRVTPIVWFLSFAVGVGYFGVVILAATVRVDEEEECIGHDASLSDADYRSILIDAVAEVPGVLLALFTIERLGRVRSMLVSWCACWVAMLLLLVFPDMETLFLFIARLFTEYTDIFIFVLTPEIYPSSCRCFAMGMMSSVSEIGGTVSPLVARELFNAYGIKAVAVIYAVLFVAADVATTLLLPFETAGRALKDDFNEFCEDRPVETMAVVCRLGDGPESIY